MTDDEAPDRRAPRLEILGEIQGEEPTVILPAMGLAKLEEIHELYHSNTIEADTMREHSARAVGMPIENVIAGKTVKLPRRLDKEEPK